MNPRTARRRLILLLLGIAAWYAVIIVRLVAVQVLEGPTLSALAERQQSSTVEITAPRGSILDRNLTPLALTHQVDSYYAVPAEVEDPAATSRALARVLRISRRSLQKRLETDAHFVWVARKVSDQQSKRIRALNLPGIASLKEPRRFYPNGKLAAHVLGYVGLDNVGLAGIEHRYDADIRGTPGRQVTLRDARGLRFQPEPGGQPAHQGHSAVLSLDAVVQYHLETSLEQAVTQSRAKGGMGVALDPVSGEILAMASLPSYDPTAYGRYSPESWRNGAVSTVFEPGSTFKLITLATALEQNRLPLDVPIDCGRGSIRVSGHRFDDHKVFDMLLPRDVLAFSSNVGAIRIGLSLPDQLHYESMRRFGFGRPTGVDLPGEERGILHQPRRWSGLSQAAISMGQEVSVTALQMASAFAAVANQGVAMRPFVLKRLVSETGDVVLAREPVQARRVVSADTAATLVPMLEEVVRNGTGRAAALDGYTAAGKTGTAQKSGSDGRGYLPGRYVASFVGFAPSRRPRLVLFVALDEPRGRYHGGEVAAPVFRRVMQPALAYLGVPPENPERRAGVSIQDHFLQPEPQHEAPHRSVAFAAWSRLHQSGEQNP
jgi:cell division protein FtsI (penicillin-binding protein 3)